MIWEHTNYTIDLPFIISKNIYEYDIRKANISVLFAEDHIGEDYYHFMDTMDKHEREVEVGYLILNDQNVYNQLSEEVKKYRRLFMEQNELEDTDIISVKNDAIFTMKRCANTKFADGIVQFIEKNKYSSFVKLGKIEVYFYSDQVNQQVSLDVKGISDDNLKLHHKYMATLIADVVLYMEKGMIQDALTMVQEIFNDYVEHKLDIEWYREFNASSTFKVKANGSIYSLNHCSQGNIEMIDISCNLNIIRELYGHLTNMYLNSRRYL